MDRVFSKYQVGICSLRSCWNMHDGDWAGPGASVCTGGSLGPAMAPVRSHRAWGCSRHHGRHLPTRAPQEYRKGKDMVILEGATVRRLRGAMLG